MPQPQDLTSLKELQNAAYVRAKDWARSSIVLQVFLYLSSVLAVSFPACSLKYLVVALPLALLGAYLATEASKHKSTAESLKREQEHCEGLGKAPNKHRIANLRVTFPKGLNKELNRLLDEGTTYASQLPVGIPKTLENLSESAWFSHHLSASCGRMLGWLFFGALALSTWLLLLCSTALAGSSVAATSAQSVASTLAFLISVGIFKHWMGYISFSQRADGVFNEARRMLSAKEPASAEDALKLLSEYQVARASAPLVPTWVWQLNQKRLNQNWSTISN